MISVIIPIFNEEKYIVKCVQSIVAQDYPKEDTEVIFVDGMSTDRTRELLRDLIQQYPYIRLLDNPQQIVPPAMNLGIRAAQGDIIIRMDAHASFPTNYISELVKNLETLQAENVGGVCRTLPVDDTPLSKSIAFALSSRFGMGNSYFRIGANEIREVDTVPFGCFRRNLFDRIGYFDEELIRNQDDEFNGRIIRNGGKIFLLPHLVIDYYARDTFRKVWSMMYQYGLFKPLVNKKLGSPATLRQFFPLCFVLGLGIGFILSLFFRPIRILYWAVIALYLLIGIAIGSRHGQQENLLKIALLMPAVYATVHIGYGTGYLVGLFKILTNSEFKVKSRR